MATLRCRVILLDESVIERDLEKKAVGQVLFNKVCEYLDLLEREYFGLATWDSSNNKVWLNCTKQVQKQIMSHDPTFTFGVKFYPPDPSVLAEDITRYLLCLQLRADLLTSRLPCPSDMLEVLGAYTVQSEFGDYNPELHGKEFFSNIPLAPDQTPELEEKVAELHRTLKSMSPDQADRLFLQNVRTLDMYGVHQHPAKDASGAEVILGVCADGLVVFEDEQRTQNFIWLTVMNMSYRRSNFLVWILDSENATKSTIKFSLPSYRACKYLWRTAVEHHAFFRNQRNVDKPPARLLQSGSRFYFHGLTHAESLEASAKIQRSAPSFSRSAIKRKAKENLFGTLKRPHRTDVDDWYQVLGSDESWLTNIPDKDERTGGKTLAYEKKEKVDGLDNEWFEPMGGRSSFPTQPSHSYLSAGKVGSAAFQHWTLQADDWFVLLEPHTYHPTFSPRKTLPLSLQSSEAEEQREELGWMERTSETTIKVVKIRKEFKTGTEHHEELEMESNLMRPDIVRETLEWDSGASDQILKVMMEKIEREGGGEGLHTVAMYEQRTYEVEPHIEESQEGFVKQSMRGMEVVDTVHKLMLKTGQVVSEENIEELEETFEEVKSIEQRMQDIELLKVRLEEVEGLEEMLQQVQRTGRRRMSDDWYILLEHKLTGFSAPARILGVEKSEQQLKRQEQGQPGDWYLLLERKPSVESSGSADLAVEKQRRQESTSHVTETQLILPTQTEEQTQKQVDDDWFIQQDVSVQATGPSMDTEEQKVEIRQWMKAALQTANTGTPVLMNDDWYILLEFLPRSTQTIQPAAPPTEIDIQSSQVHVIEEQEHLAEEKQWRKQSTIHVRETQLTSPTQTEEHTQKQVDDDWLILQDVSLKQAGPTVDTQEQKGWWTEAERQKTNPIPPVQMKDDWYILLELLPTLTQTVRPVLPPSEIDIQSSQVHVIEEQEHLAEEKQWREQSTSHVRETQLTSTTQTEEQTQKQVDDDWLILQDVSLKQAGPTVDTQEQKGWWTEAERQKTNPIPPVQMNDDWYILLELLPTLTQTVRPVLPPSEIDIQSSRVHVIEEQEHLAEEKQWRKQSTIHVRETQPTSPTQTEEQTQKQVDDDWLILQDVSLKQAGPTMDTEEQKVEIRQWIKAERRTANTRKPVQMNDDWYILLEFLPRFTQTIQPAPAVYKETREEEVKIITSVEERRKMIETSQEMFEMSQITFEERGVPSASTTLISEDTAGWRHQHTVTIKEKEVAIDKQPTIVRKTRVTVEEVGKKFPARTREDEDDWFVLFTPAQIEKKVITTAGLSDTRILEEKRLMEVPKERLRGEVKRSHVVEDKRLHPFVPGPKVEERHREMIDDWFIQLEPVSKKSVSMDRRAEEDQRRMDELFKKRAAAEDRRKVAVPVVPLTPADQPMTSTPTAQSIRVTRPTYREENLKRLDITQEVTQDIKQESKVETETVIKKKKRVKRIDGESIYIRHSILMLEDTDVTQEVVLRHHASVSELKRIFMEDIPVSSLTEWDRRLSSYTPVVYPKLSSGELFTGIDIMGADGILVM